MRILVTSVVMLLSFALTAIPSMAGTPVCGIIAGPIPVSYLTGTNKCLMGETVGATTTHCVDNSGIEATFATPVTEFNAGVSGGGWATWSSPPFSEYPFPWVGFTNATSNTITLTRVAGVLGMEIEPNHFPVHQVTATFRNGSGAVLTVHEQAVSGFAGARLFAAVCNTPVIKSVVISTNDESGFAVAQIRSDRMIGIFAPLPSIPIIPAEVPSGATSNHEPNQ